MLLSALACLGAAGALAAHLCRRRAAAARREFAVAKGIRRAAEQVRCVAAAAEKSSSCGSNSSSSRQGDPPRRGAGGVPTKQLQYYNYCSIVVVLGRRRMRAHPLGAYGVLMVVVVVVVVVMLMAMMSITLATRTSIHAADWPLAQQMHLHNVVEGLSALILTTDAWITSYNNVTCRGGRAETCSTRSSP